MATKTRGKALVLAVSLSLVAYALLGGFLGKALARDSAYRYLAVFQDVLSLVTSAYVEPVNVETIREGAIRGMMDALDPDSVYLTPEEFALLTSGERPPGREAGVGVGVSKRFYVEVAAVFPGSPADAAGLKPGDLLKSIDGVNTREVNVVVGENLLRGPVGSTAKLEVIRGRSAEPLEVTVERKLFAEKWVTHKTVDSETGYVRVVGLGPDVAREVASAVTALATEGAADIVVDLRDALGRTGDDGARVAELFIDGGLAATLQGRDGAKTEVRLVPGRVVHRGPVALLINERTAGAAEVLAAAFATAGRGELIGNKTAGRAAIQKPSRLADGSGLLLSASQYWTADGKAILGEGITPTVEVEERLTADESEGAEDPVLKKALEVLRSARAKKAA
jgi:carboxyl-terminal processing protease